MAVDSKRELITLQVVSEIKSLNSISTVVRRMQSHSDLKNFAVTQLPAVAVVARLPVPDEHTISRSKPRADVIISSLIVDLYTYFQERDNPDSMLSNLADDIWVKIYADQTKNKLVLSTKIKLAENPEYWDPFVAFKASCYFTYVHSIRGI